MLKRIAALMLLPLFLLPLGCAKNSGQSGEAEHGAQAEATIRPSETDASEPTALPEQTARAEREYCIDMRYGKMLETDSMLFCSYGNVLYFTDKEYKDWMPLCPRPDCKHDTEDCSACMKGCAGPWVYGHWLYFVKDAFYVEDEAGEGAERRYTEAELWRMRFDGTAHEKVCGLPIPEPQTFEKAFENSWLAAWQGRYLIIKYTAYKDTRHNVKESFAYVMALDTLETVEVEYFDFPTDDPTGVLLYGEGDNVYVFHSYYPCEVTENTTLADRRYFLSLLNCAAGEQRFVGPLEQNAFITEGGLAFADGKFTYCVWPGADIVSYYSLDLATGEGEFLHEYRTNAPYPHNYDYKSGLWYCWYVQHRQEYLEETMPIWGLYLYDRDLEPVESRLLSDMNADDFDDVQWIMCWSQSDDYIFGCGPVIEVDKQTGEEYKTWPMGGSVPDRYISKADIGTDGLMWRKWEP